MDVGEHRGWGVVNFSSLQSKAWRCLKRWLSVLWLQSWPAGSIAFRTMMRQNTLVVRVCGRRNCLPHGSELKAVREERGSGIVPQGTSLVICSFSWVLPSKFSSSPSSPPNPPISGLIHRRGRSLHDSIISPKPHFWIALHWRQSFNTRVLGDFSSIRYTWRHLRARVSHLPVSLVSSSSSESLEKA